MNIAAQGTEQWHAARRGRITASVIGKVITGKGRDEVLRDMVREALGYPRAFTGNIATDYGTEHEDEARTDYALETGQAATETGFHLHPEIEWMGASPDGLVGVDGLVEIKCPFKLRNADSVPDELMDLDSSDLYWHQMQCQMHVMGREWCDFVVWCPGGMQNRRYHIDDDWLVGAWAAGDALMRELGEILADSDRAEQVADTTQDMSDDESWLSTALQYAFLDEEIKRKKAALDMLRQDLIEMAGERKASGGGITVSPVTRPGGVDYAAMAKAAGVDPEQYRKPASTSWQIRVSKEKDNG